MHIHKPWCGGKTIWQPTRIFFLEPYHYEKYAQGWSRNPIYNRTEPKCGNQIFTGSFSDWCLHYKGLKFTTKNTILQGITMVLGKKDWLAWGVAAIIHHFFSYWKKWKRLKERYHSWAGGRSMWCVVEKRFAPKTTCPWPLHRAMNCHTCLFYLGSWPNPLYWHNGIGIYGSNTKVYWLWMNN